LEGWGLVPQGAFDGGLKSASERADKKKKTAGPGKASSSAPAAPAASASALAMPTSLVEAVAKAREACRFRYVTAAAPVVYGIPIYVSK
jgi:separase